MSYDPSKSKHWLHNSNLKTLLNSMFGSINDQNGVYVLNNPALKIGSSDAEKVKFEDVEISRNGVLEKIDSDEIAFTATTHDIAADSTKEVEAIFTVYIDADGDGKLEMGEIADATKAVAPVTPEGGLKLGEVKIKVDQGSDDFDATSDLLSAGHLTVTYSNVLDAPVALSEWDSKYWLHRRNLYNLLVPANAILRGQDRVLGKPTLAAGTSDAEKLKHAEFDVYIDGEFKTVGAGEVGLTPTTHDISAEGAKDQEATYLVTYNGTAVKIYKGATADEDSVAPALPEGEAQVGTFKIVVATGSTDFTAGTDDLDDTHTTPTFSDAMPTAASDFSLDRKAKHYLYQQNLSDVVEPMVAALNQKNKEILLSTPTFAKGSGNTGVAHAAFKAIRNGTLVEKGAETTGVALTASDHNVAAGKARRYNIHLNASNNVAFVAGEEVPVADHANSVCPDTPENCMKIGELVIRNASASVFTAATTHLDATDITTNYINKVETLEQF